MSSIVGNPMDYFQVGQQVGAGQNAGLTSFINQISQRMQMLQQYGMMGQMIHGQGGGGDQGDIGYTGASIDPTTGDVRMTMGETPAARERRTLETSQKQAQQAANYPGSTEQIATQEKGVLPPNVIGGLFGKYRENEGAIGQALQEIHDPQQGYVHLQQHLIRKTLQADQAERLFSARYPGVQHPPFQDEQGGRVDPQTIVDELRRRGRVR